MEKTIENMIKTYSYTSKSLEIHKACKISKKRKTIKQALQKYLINDSDMLEKNIMKRIIEYCYPDLEGPYSDNEILDIYDLELGKEVILSTFSPEYIVDVVPHFGEFLMGIYAEDMPDVFYCFHGEPTIEIKLVETDIYYKKNRYFSLEYNDSEETEESEDTEIEESVETEEYDNFEENKNMSSEKTDLNESFYDAYPKEGVENIEKHSYLDEIENSKKMKLYLLQTPLDTECIRFGRLRITLGVYIFLGAFLYNYNIDPPKKVVLKDLSDDGTCVIRDHLLYLEKDEEKYKNVENNLMLDYDTEKDQYGSESDLERYGYFEESEDSSDLEKSENSSYLEKSEDSSDFNEEENYDLL